MSALTLRSAAREDVRFYAHELGGAIGWVLVDLGDWLHEIAYRVSGGETPTRDTLTLRNVIEIAESPRALEIVRAMSQTDPPT